MAKHLQIPVPFTRFIFYKNAEIMKTEIDKFDPCNEALQFREQF